MLYFRALVIYEIHPMEQAIKDKINNIQLPGTEINIGQVASIENWNIKNNLIQFDLCFRLPILLFAETVKQQIQETISDYQFTINCLQKISSHKVQNNLKPIPGVKNIIVVASGKGGVGKSTTCVNLALALSQQGANVGIMDADIYGPNQPHMLGVMRQPDSPDGKSILPIICHGLQTMSIAYLVEDDTAMIWRGPMVTRALQQLLNDTKWQDLDYLLLDMPPGTGDIQLTTAQKIPVVGSVVVTTPQDIALLDVTRAIKMFQRVDIDILGIVENMSLYHCPQCGFAEPIFGAEGALKLSQEFNLPLLGQIPLNRAICDNADQGTPIVAMDPDCIASQYYNNIALKLAARIAMKDKTYAHKFPNIVVENK